nr:L-type lectin-domain containing receptor kinase IX.2-like [Lolium perenne]
MVPASATARIILVACFFFLLLSSLANHVAAAWPPLSFSFDFSDTSKYRLADLRFEGDAALNGKLVDLTCNPTAYYCSGRMSYNHPVQFYDNTTGELASFSTTFTFAMNMLPNTTIKGDGMSFFISGYPSRLPPESYGSILGLTNSSTNISSGADRFLAVEFDTYGNPWDPTGSPDHMGIDLNSITSVSITRLPRYSFNGTMTATITFDNTTRTLEATVHFDYNSSLATASVKTQLSDQLDALLPPVVVVGFSAATGGYVQLHQIHSWSFNSTMAARETSSGATNKFGPIQNQVLDSKDRHRTYIIGGAVILALALLLAIWSTVAWCRWKCTCAHFGKDRGITRFHYHDLSIATNKFSDIIGQGGFSVVYSGILNNEQVAVKKIIKDSKGEFKDFLTERATIGNTRHMNVLKLEGWCCTISNFKYWFSHTLDDVMLFLVYELIANGNLHEHLSEKPEVLSWEKRYKIVKGLCSALHYLHHQCSPYILHRDIKPGNILLDNEFNAKLGDFGLSRVAKDGEEIALQTRAVGTALYMDPLCMKDGHVDFRRSSDVYSFGIVLLEIAHGENDPFLVHKLRTDLPETFVKDFADKKLDGKFIKTEMERVILLGLRCTEREENQRPSLITATYFLENGGELRPATAAPA